MNAVDDMLFCQSEKLSAHALCKEKSFGCIKASINHGTCTGQNIAPCMCIAYRTQCLTVLTQ